MHFQLGAANSEIPPLRIGTRTQGADYGMPIGLHPMAFNHSFSSLQFFNESGHGGSEVETLEKFPPSEVETLVKFPPLEADQIDDLSAVVTKCTNRTVLTKLYPYPGLSGCGAVNSIPPERANVYSQDSIDGDKNNAAHCMHRKIGAKAAQPVPQFPSNESKDGRVQDAEDFKVKPPKMKRCDDAQTSAVVSDRGIHILTERQRRSGMNQLFSNMRSLLPDQTAKSDKTSIVAETISYIHYLQQRLHTCSKKRAGAGSSHQTGPSTAETILSTTGSSDNAILPEISLKSHSGKDLYITITCAKKGNLLPSIILVMEEHNLEVMDAFVSTNDRVAFHSLHLKALQALDAAGRKALTDTLHMLIKSELQISLEP